MRTTLNLDDDVLQAVKERARHEKRTAGEVLSDLARQALLGSSRSGARPDRYGLRPLLSRGGTVSNELIDQLRDGESM